MPILNKFNRVLPCALTDAEVKEKGEQLAAVCTEIEAAEAEKKRAAEQHKKAIEALEVQRDKLVQLVTEKVEHREIACEEVLVRYDGKVRVFRKDTDAQVEERDATERELLPQPTLFDGEGVNPKPPDELGLGPDYTGTADGPVKPPEPPPTEPAPGAAPAGDPPPAPTE